MVSHVRALGWIGVVRGLLGSKLGALLIFFSVTPRLERQAELWDIVGFRVAGGLLIVLSAAWAIQGFGALMGRPGARRFGLLLGILDIVNLVLFPLSTVLGLYAIVTYRNPETIHYFGARASGLGICRAV